MDDQWVKNAVESDPASVEAERNLLRKMVEEKERAAEERLAQLLKRG